jgi:hypothetical protein
MRTQRESGFRVPRLSGVFFQCWRFFRFIKNLRFRSTHKWNQESSSGSGSSQNNISGFGCDSGSSCGSGCGNQNQFQSGWNQY